MFRYNNPDALLALLLTGADLRHHPRPRAGADQVARAGRRAGRLRLHHQDAAGLPDPPGHRPSSTCSPRRPAGGAGSGRSSLMGVVRGGRGRLVGGRRRADAGRRPPLRRRLAGQQHPQPDLRLQRLRPAHRQRDRAAWRRRRRRRRMWGPTGCDPAVQRRVRRTDVVAPARRARRWAPSSSSSPSRARRTDRERAALLLWGGSLVVHRARHQLRPGDHPPLLHGRPGAAARRARRHRAPWACGSAATRWVGRVGLAAGLAATVVWSYVLLGRTSDWFPALRPFVLVAGALGVVAILALPLLRSRAEAGRRPRRGARPRRRARRAAVLDRGHRGHAAQRAPSRR